MESGTEAEKDEKEEKGLVGRNVNDQDRQNVATLGPDKVPRGVLRYAFPDVSALETLYPGRLTMINFTLAKSSKTVISLKHFSKDDASENPAFTSRTLLLSLKR